MISDNGPQYVSQDKKFSKQWGCQDSKKTMKAKLLDHRNTPSQDLDSGPPQRLFSHGTKTLLPTKATLLRPKVVWVAQNLKNKQQCQSTYYNRSARDLDMLATGDCVRIQPLPPHTVWRSGRVLKPIGGRSYKVQLHWKCHQEKSQTPQARTWGGLQ